MLARQRHDPRTIAAFDAFVERHGDEVDYELIAGEIVMMTNPNQRHEQVISNIALALKQAMDKRKCRTYSGGMRVQLSDARDGQNKTRPDVAVRCGPVTPQSELRSYITDPIVIVEVLSPSTMDYDRGAKLDFYKSMPSLSHIAIVYQDQMRIEHYRRADDGWVTDVLTKPTDELTFEAVAFAMPVSQADFDITFD